MPMFGKRVPYVPKHMRGIEEDQDTDISRHGIKGMKWGVRRYQNPDGMDQGLNDQEFFNKATSNDPVL